MKIEYEILINQYGQNVVEIEQLISIFEKFDTFEKKVFLKEILFNFIVQSKPKSEDIQSVIMASGLKSTYTPCVLLKKGVEYYKLEKMIDLPSNELKKVFILFLNLFKIAYCRRYEVEKNNPDKWWYWDLSDNKTINVIISKMK